MAFIDGILGNASNIDLAEIQQEFRQILAPGEIIEQAYKIIRDYLVFTNKRFVLVDRQGVTGKKVEYHSIPYKSITHFSIETAGTFDLDAELKVWISGAPTPIQRKFNSRLNIYEVQSVLASYVLGNASLDALSVQRIERPLKGPNMDLKQQKSSDTEFLSENQMDVEARIEFCFHCGEAYDGISKKCQSCGGILQ
jgi:hypothetical protein